MNSPGPEHQFKLAHHSYLKGKMEGRVELTVKMIEGWFGPLPDTIQTRVRGTNDAHLDAMAERMLSAQSLEQALGSLSTGEPG